MTLSLLHIRKIFWDWCFKIPRHDPRKQIVLNFQPKKGSTPGEEQERRLEVEPETQAHYLCMFDDRKTCFDRWDKKLGEHLSSNCPHVKIWRKELRNINSSSRAKDFERWPDTRVAKRLHEFFEFKIVDDVEALRWELSTRIKRNSLRQKDILHDHEHNLYK